jgi:heme/copper-type cytochrome/quinol oxidase subunit 2
VWADRHPLRERVPPSEASCRECKKRWQLEAAAEAAKTPEQRRREKANAWVGAVVIFAVVLAVTIYMVAHGHH